jgi:hypothetical protein
MTETWPKQICTFDFEGKRYILLVEETNDEFTDDRFHAEEITERGERKGEAVYHSVFTFAEVKIENGLPHINER